MKTSKKGIDIIKKWEGFRSKPYKDVGGIPTIGYGATHYGNGMKVTMYDKPITKDEALGLLSFMVPEYENYVNQLVSACLNQNQYDALVSFTYNLGPSNLSNSTLLGKVNINPNDASIAYEFSRWNKSGGRVYNGLVARRKQEAELYFELKCS